MNHIVERDLLPVFPVGPLGSHAHILNGNQHEFPGMSLMLSVLQPGEGPALHRHDYGEAFVLGEGRATFTISDEVFEAGPGQVVLIPAGVPHAFANAGSSVLSITAIHVASNVGIDWIDPPWTPGEE